MKKTKDKVTALILTGGSGTRMQLYSEPKQFIKIIKYPAFVHVIRKYEQIKEVDENLAPFLFTGLKHS